MDDFAYKGYTITGPTQGIVRAPSRQTAEKRLRSQGITPQRLSKTKKHKDPVFWLFVKTLNILLGQNIKLHVALEIMQNQQSTRVRDAAERILIKLGDGETFSEALPQVFGGLSAQTIQLIDIGVKNSGLAQAIALIANEHENSVRQKQELAKAISYPAFVLAFSIIALITIFDTVLPEFGQLLQGSELSAMQQVIMGAAGRGYSGFITVFWAILGCVGLGYLISLHRPTILRLTHILDLVPIIKSTLRVRSRAQFLHALALALYLKLDLTDASLMAAEYVSNPAHRKRLLGIKPSLLEGQTFRATLAKTELFEDMQLALVEVAERANRLPECVMDLDQAMIQQRAHRLSLISQVIGPLSIIVLGIIIFLVAFVVVTPMMSLQNSIG